MNITFLLWHTPAAYDYALWNEPWHRVEHICFLSHVAAFLVACDSALAGAPS